MVYLSQVNPSYHIYCSHNIVFLTFNPFALVKFFRAMILNFTMAHLPVMNNHMNLLDMGHYTTNWKSPLH